MPDISIRNIVHAFEEDNNILDGLSFEVAEGEKVGLVGKNGAGKTTLFRVICGEIDSDEGDVAIPGGKRVGLISQMTKYPEGFTTEDVLKSAHDRLYKMQDRIGVIQMEMGANPSPGVLAEYDALQNEFTMQGGWDMDFERSRVANGLDIPEAMRAQEFASLSGGEKTRVNLARLILEDTDILLLDEPTNHLDMRSTEWLEEYLVKYRGTVVVVSHDRYFLDRVVTRTVEIVNGKAEIYPGNYSFFAEEKQRRYEEQLIKYEREQKEAKRLDEAADRLAAWGTGNKRLMRKSFAIRRRAERAVTVERPQSEKKMKAKFSERTFYGDEVLIIDGLIKAFGDRTILNDITLSVEGGERIALIGENGTGKTTLLRIVMGEEEPERGLIRQGPSVRDAYLPQHVTFNNPNLSALDTLIYEENLSHQSARNRLGAFKFSGEEVFRPVWALSGGEQSRLRLCMLMKDDINFLILDEPTNHLDIMSREWMEEALMEYNEALLFVSHDRYFINRFATRVWELDGVGGITDFRGGFEEFREYKARTAQIRQVVKNDAKKRDNKKKSAPSPEKRLQRLEKEISRLEEQLRALDALEQEHSSDYERLLEISAERETLDTELTSLYEAWEEIFE